MADFDQLPANFPKPGASSYKGLVSIDNSGTIPTGGLALNKTTRVARVPKGFVLTGFRFRIGDADSNGSPAIVLKLGDSGDDDRIMTVNTVAQAGGEVTALADTGFLYEYTADTDIDLLASTAAATAVAAAFKLSLVGYMK